MSKLLFIDSDDIVGLSEALRKALERRGVRFICNGRGEFDYPSDDEDEPDIDPYLGVMPHRSQNHEHKQIYGGCGGKTYGSCGQEVAPSYGGCGGGGSCGYSDNYGHCGYTNC